MKLVALSGGIAAGKSTIAKRLRELGAHHIDADLLAREAVAPGSEGLRHIREHFGPGVISKDGTLDRAQLGARVFANTTELEALNAIVHPEVRKLATARIDEIRAQDDDAIVIYDVPLLVEAGVNLPWDLVVIAEAPAPERLRRLIEIRGMSEVEAQRRIAHQADDSARRAVADVVIDTSSSVEETLRQTDALWKNLIKNER